MDTEGRLERYRKADQWPIQESLAAMLDSQMAAYHAIRSALPEITAAVDAALARLRVGDGRIIYAGAGASIRLAVQDGVELFPTFGWPISRVHYLIAGGPDALVRSMEGAEDNNVQGRLDADNAELGPSDVLIAVAASGRTPYTIGAIEQARMLGSLTIGLASNPSTPVLTQCEYPVPLLTGPEFLAGSTRMIAGTAQKISLNMISTQVMMGLGHIHDGLMVNVVQSNEKLKKRAIAIVAAISGCTDKEAGNRLIEANGDIKLAVLLEDGLDSDQARRRLLQAEGRLRVARELT